jgi:hypothetical protein
MGASDMGGRLWACKHGKNDEGMTEASHRYALKPQRRRVKDLCEKPVTTRTIFQFQRRAEVSARRSAWVESDFVSTLNIRQYPACNRVIATRAQQRGLRMRAMRKV